MEVDSAYANLFGTQGEAAVLACDELGLVPRDLLRRSKKSFGGDGDPEGKVLVRYTLTERIRQNNIRKLLAVKNRFIVEGGVAEKWKERCRVFPDAPGVPKIPKAAMEAAMAELDTESDDDDTIDERGLVRPPPQFGVATPNGGAESGVPLSRRPSQSGPVTVASSHSTAPPTPAPLFVSPPRSQTKKKRHKRLSKRSARESAHNASDKEEYVICRDGDQDVVMRRPHPPADPPYLPPVPYPVRNTATLTREMEELDEYRRFLLRYAHDSAAMAQEYSDFEQLMRHRNAANGAAAAGTVSFVSEAQQRKGADTSAASSVKNRDSEKNTNTTPSKSGTTRHERQIAAYIRLAKMDVQRNSSNYKKWNGFMEEMEGIEPMGTVAADLRARLNIGLWPTFEDYVRSVEERTKRRERAFLQERQSQNKLSAFCEAKDRHTEQTIEKLKNEENGIFLEARIVQREIMKQNRVHEDRRYNMKQQRSQVCQAKKETRAAEYHAKKNLAAKNKRFEHDSEEVFRQSLREKIHEMDVRKKWDVNSVANR
ncbi:hypothetical protein DQ04_03091040 [Trypanosoma grayi]|uniref:hypothetical protein n=1 Tax=Trypanosoma grayi TaxID=71804 RepID=UPI0004F4195F|nr:hypothetical protein DQ04_03091040 [Trypanosoma grayi]KEG10978.1 hypothetical protein DQ04_03091040 [Trypanosoma grayi]